MITTDDLRSIVRVEQVLAAAQISGDAALEALCLLAVGCQLEQPNLDALAAVYPGTPSSWRAITVRERIVERLLLANG